MSIADWVKHRSLVIGLVSALCKVEFRSTTEWKHGVCYVTYHFVDDSNLSEVLH